eukprot:12909740-Prorocentrum_lima.AAC.1
MSKAFFPSSCFFPNAQGQMGPAWLSGSTIPGLASRQTHPHVHALVTDCCVSKRLVDTGR